MYALTTDIDQILGKLPVSSGMDKQTFIDISAAEMHTYMLGIYTVPIHIPSSVATATSGITSNILKSINQDLATGRLILALDTTMENQSIHEYGSWLVDKSITKLEEIRSQKFVLPGAPIDTNLSDDIPRPGKVYASSPDSSSSFGISYNEIANQNYKVTDGLLDDNS